MPRSRFDRLTPARRDEILDVAARHFAAGGYEGASYNRILDEARLSKGSAYYTFDGKADLYAAVLRREMERMLAALSPPEPPTSAASYWRGVRDWLDRALSFFQAHPETTTLLRGYAAAREAGAAPPLDQAIEEVAVGSMHPLVEAGLSVGAVRDDLDLPLLASLATAVITTLDYRYLGCVGSMSDEERSAMLDVYVDTLTRLLKPARPRRG